MTNLSRRDFLRVSAAGLAGAGMAGITAHADDAFTFAAINDTHVKDAESVAIVEKAVAMINGDARVGFTAILGDVATDGKPEELALVKAAFEKLDKPSFVVPGNHDVFLRAPDLYGNYVDAFGPVHWVHQQNGWAFIGLNSCEGVKSDVVVAREELDWLRARLGELDGAQPLALFCHHPLNPNTKAYRVSNAEEILALFEKHTLKIAAAGHWHGNQIEERDGVLYTTTACCASTRNNFDGTDEKGYRLFHLRNGAVETEFVVVRHGV